MDKFRDAVVGAVLGVVAAIAWLTGYLGGWWW